MIINGMISLGRDSELKYAQSGTAVLRFSGAYTTGYGDNKETQWLGCALFGKQGERLAEYLKKGTKVFINGKDIKINTYNKGDGSTGVSLECIVNEIEFAGGGQSEKNSQGNQPHQNNQQADNFQQPKQQAPVNNDAGFDNDDVPF